VNGIINYAEILADRLGTEGPLIDLGERIIREGERISSIVRNLLDFARPRGTEMAAVDVASQLRDSLALTAAVLRRGNVEYGLEIVSDLPQVLANAGQLRQVFLNIISNARQALDEKYPAGNPGKRLDIRVIRLAGPPERIRLYFTDYGCGIAPGNLERVMNPFFTTKPAGKGTGLGLSISHGIIADHGGTLRIESVEDYYTQVRIDLPAIDSR
jgi:signal transduction histidine kinase